MNLTIRKSIFILIFNFSLFFFLMISIQNSFQKSRINLILKETISLPISFIMGVSFITGSITGGTLTFKFENKK